MYDQMFEYFGLRQNPFQVSPNPEFFVWAAGYDKAVRRLVSGIQNRLGFMLLTGEPGTGKTTVIHYLLEWLHQHDYSSSYVFHSLLSSRDLLEFILRDFGVSSVSGDKSEVRTDLHKWLIGRRDAGDHPVIIVDEAQALSRCALKEIYHVLHLEPQAGDLVQIVLAGQPGIAEKLRQPEMVRLRRDLRCRCRLTAMTAEETAGYIDARLRKAGHQNVQLFPETSVQEVHRYSRGTPRVVNMICEHALLAAFVGGIKFVAPEHVIEVARRFDLAAPAPAPDTPVASTSARVIQFPDPSLPVAVQAKAEDAETIEMVTSPEMEMPQPVAALVAESLEAPRPEPATVAIEPKTPKPKTRPRGVGLDVRSFVHYWGAVRKSIVRDCRNFVAAMASWKGEMRVMLAHWGAASKSVARDSRKWLKTGVSTRPTMHPDALATMRFGVYWHAVGKSLVRDWRSLWNALAVWRPTQARPLVQRPAFPVKKRPVFVAQSRPRPINAQVRRRFP
jgi:general secretion pathway protein A